MLLALSKQSCSTSVVANKEEDSLDVAGTHYSATESTEIKIVIGSSTRFFSIKQLSTLSYFQARLSTRWSNNNVNCNNTKEIHILSPSFNNNNKNEINFSSQSQLPQFNFTCDHLDLLLQCLAQCKIPSNLSLDLNELESLLYCQDYLNPQSNVSSDNDNYNYESFAIDEETLLKYFHNRIPSVNKKQRDEMFASCKHPLLRKALTQLINEYEAFAKQSQTQVFSHAKELISDKSNKEGEEKSAAFIISLLKRVKLNAIDATKLFESIFRINATAVKNDASLPTQQSRESSDDFLSSLSSYYSINIDIPKINEYYSGESLLCFLWSLCEHGRHLSASTFEQIDHVITKILDKNMIGAQIEAITENNSYQSDPILLIWEIFVDLTVALINEYLSIDDRRLRKTKHINICGLTQARLLVLTHCNPYLGSMHFMNLQEYNYLNSKENEELATLVCGLMKEWKYLPICIEPVSFRFDDADLDSLNTYKQNVNDLINFLKNTLLRCSSQFVTKTMEDWFPILHRKKREWYNQGRNGMISSPNYRAESDVDSESDHGDHDRDDDQSDEKREYFGDDDIEKIIELSKDHEKEMAQWIIDNLIKTTDQCFDFGIYLSNFFIFEHKPMDDQDNITVKIPFPKVYHDFMQDHCNITWQLL